MRKLNDIAVNSDLFNIGWNNSFDEDFHKNVIAYQMTGSYVIAPTEKPNDIDVIVLVKDMKAIHKTLMKASFSFTDMYRNRPSNMFTSYKGEVRGLSAKKLVNIIATDRPHWYIKFCAATAYAKQLGLDTKPERVALFNTVLENIEEEGIEGDF